MATVKSLIQAAGGDALNLPTNPTANRGHGGGGGANVASFDVGANGSDGVVIISYATDGSDGIDPSSTGGTKTTSGGQTIHTFTTSGTFTAVFASAAVVNKFFLTQ